MRLWAVDDICFSSVVIGSGIIDFIGGIVRGNFANSDLAVAGVCQRGRYCESTLRKYGKFRAVCIGCLLYTSPSPRDS